MELFRIIGVGVVTAITSMLLRATKPELSFAVVVSGVIIILLFLLDLLKTSVGALQSIASVTGIENGMIKILLKMIGVGYLAEFGAGILRDFGSEQLSDKIILAGKLTVLVLSIPIIESVLEVFSQFVSLL